MGDWVSCFGYGTIQSVPAGRNALFPLLTMPAAGAYDAAQPYGGPAALSTVFDGFVERLVGTWYQFPPANEGTAQRYGWRVYELPWDFGAAAFDAPWTSTDSVMLSGLNTDIARWWVERFRNADNLAGYLPGLDSIDHPWWTHADCHPNSAVGAQSGFWPCLVVDNVGGAEDLQFVHRFRMYGEWRTR